jgi:hypothetical protein
MYQKIVESDQTLEIKETGMRGRKQGDCAKASLKRAVERDRFALGGYDLIHFNRSSFAN